jgi:hypothetical protein
VLFGRAFGELHFHPPSLPSMPKSGGHGCCLQPVVPLFSSHPGLPQGQLLLETHEWWV